MKMETKTNIRRNDLDWLRVIGILTVFVFHSLRFFAFDDWHVMSSRRSLVADEIISVLNLWIMPLMFLISGASIYYGFSRGKPGKFALDKVLRLLVPLLVNAFTLCMLQVYLEHITHHQFNGSIIEFIPHYFQGIYGITPGDNFALVGMHLWYVAALFVFSILLIPVFVLLKSQRGERILSKAMDFLGIPGLAYLLVIPISLIKNFACPYSILGYEISTWSVGIYLWCLLACFMIMSSQRLQVNIQRLRWISLAIAVIAAVVAKSTDDVLEDTAMWFGLMAFLGFAMKYLNFSTPFLKYAAPAVLPFYILHQTVLLCSGYFVMQWQVPVYVTWLVNTSISFAVIMVLYEFVVRRSNVMRFLFGMKPVKKQSTASEVPALQGEQQKI